MLMTTKMTTNLKKWKQDITNSNQMTNLLSACLGFDSKNIFYEKD